MGVYVIAGAVTGAVKVGPTNDIYRRFKHHQTSCSEHLTLSLWIPDWPDARETELHRRLRPYRSGGGSDWYRACDEVSRVLWELQLQLTPGQALTSYQAMVDLNDEDEDDEPDCEHGLDEDCACYVLVDYRDPSVSSDAA